MKIKKMFGQEIFEYTGCIHIHTEHSYDARGRVEDIIEEARAADLDYIAVTDHLSMEAKKSLDSSNFFTLSGYEMNDRKKNNHYLTFNTDKVLSPSLTAKEYVQDIKKNDGVGFIAHPFEKRKTKRYRKFEWTDWSISDFDGIEIWNFLSQWTGSITMLNLPFRILFPHLSITKPPSENLEKWDEVNLKGFKKSAIGGIDVHANRYSWGPVGFTLFPHKQLFRTIRTNFWLREKLTHENFQSQILTALKNGNSYIVNLKRQNPQKFYCGISSKTTNKFALPGENIALENGELSLSVYTPQDCTIKIIHNGEKIKSEYINKLSVPITKTGFYRVEVYLGFYGWIFSNPIYVTEY